MSSAAKQRTGGQIAQTGRNDGGKAHIRAFRRSLPMLLMRAREAVMQRFRPHLRHHDITEQQWRILRVLAEEKRCDMLDLAVRCCIHPPSLSRTIPLLVSRGLVCRTTGASDQRRVVVELTSEGRTLFRKMSAESVQVYSQLEADIGASRLAEVYRILDEIISLAGPEQEDSGEDM